MRKLITFGCFLPVVGICLLVVGFKEKEIAGMASKVPEEISLKNLIARGPDGNPNIILTDFVLCDNYVYKTRGTAFWTNAWIPVVPRQAQGVRLAAQTGQRACPGVYHQCSQ